MQLSFCISDNRNNEQEMDWKLTFYVETNAARTKTFERNSWS